MPIIWVFSVGTATEGELGASCSIAGGDFKLNRSSRQQTEEAVHCRGDSRIARKRTVQPTVTTTNRGGNTHRRDRRPRRSANEHFNQPPRQSTEKAV